MPRLLDGDCHWLEWSERLGLRGTVTGGREERKNPSVSRVLKGQLGLRAGAARRAGRPAGGGGSGACKSALFLRVPRRSPLKGG